MVRRLPTELRRAVWDLDVERLDVAKDADAIIPRVLENGGALEVRALVELYGLDRIHAFFRAVAHPLVSERTRGFWRAFFRAEGESWPTLPSWRQSTAAPWID